VALGFGPVLEQVGHACEREGLGLGLHELAAGAGDAFDGALGGGKLLCVDDVFELGQREVVEVAQVEGADGRVEQVLEEVGGELARFAGLCWLCRVHHHAGIVARRLSGTSGSWGSARIWRTRRVMRGQIAHNGGDA
jgi:hypothetical protein